jgi:tripartite-type tricarboxylate transporter receptor subunit TctC
MKARIAAITGACLLAFRLAPACAAEAASYQGMTLTVFSSTSPGGGYDSYARLLARYIGRYLPGNPNVVVKTMTGAAGFTLANYLYGVAPRNGSEIGILEANVAFSPLLSGTPAKFDPAKFGWLGSLDQFVPLVLAWHSTPFHSLQDLMTKPMNVGSTGAGGNMSTYALVLNHVLGTKLKVINGYPGSSEITLAVERGELDGMTGWCWTCMKTQKPDWIAEDKVRVLMQLTTKGDPELNAKKVPTAFDVAQTDQQRQLMRIAFASAAVSRPFTAPPGLPPERLALLRNAFAAAAKNPELIADAARTGNEVAFVSADDTLALIKEVYANDRSLIATLQRAVAAQQ